MSPENGDRLLTLAEKVKDFPESPGVYLMVDAHSRVLYIGKAGNLRKRVGAYFSKHPDNRTFVPLILQHVADVQYLITANESEALILENNLIKKYKPPYNIRLKDDKTYVSIKVTVNEKWPRLLVVRRHHDDGALYFGPYASAAGTRWLQRFIQEICGLRSCSPQVFKSRTRPCLQYEVGRCCAPCVGFVTESEYSRRVEEALLLLRGRGEGVLKRLESEMHKAASELRFEEAASLRDKLTAMRRALERQAAHKVGLQEDLDVFGLHREGRHVTVLVIFVRNGQVIQAAPFQFQTALPIEEALRSFVVQFYLAGRDVPPGIVLPVRLPDSGALAELLARRRGGSVRFYLGKRGLRRELLQLAVRNAEEAAKGQLVREERRREALAELASALGLQGPPARIECFDISTTGGALAVGSMAVMLNGNPAPDQYRHYKIRTVEGMDDFAMLAEVIKRRLEDETPPPDLLVVDGGKGQVQRAAEVLAERGLSHTIVIGLAKGRYRGGRRTEERIFTPNRSEPLDLDENSAGSRLLQALRDEAHRFAVSYHRKLRRRKALSSGLEKVPGLGPKRIRVLYEKFGGMRQLRKLSVEELVSEGKLPRPVAENLWRFLHPEGTPQEGAGSESS